MKVLLDECVDARLAREIAGHEVRTVHGMGWSGLDDGRILRLAESGFDAFVTIDRNLQFQQNLSAFRLAILVLRGRTNRLADLKRLVPDLLATLATAEAGKATHVGP